MGFGFGDAVIVELLKNKNAMPDTSVGDIDVMVFAQDPVLYPKAIHSATLLRSNGFIVDLVLEQKKLKWVFQRADRLKAGEKATFSMKRLDLCLDAVLMHSEREDATGEVVVKNLKTGEQSSLPKDQITATVARIKLENRNLTK